MKAYSQIYLTFGAQSRHEGQIGSADLWKGEVCWSGLLESQSFESLRNFNRIKFPVHDPWETEPEETAPEHPPCRSASQCLVI